MFCFVLFLDATTSRQYSAGARPAGRSQETVFGRQLPLWCGSDACSRFLDWTVCNGLTPGGGQDACNSLDSSSFPVGCCWVCLNPKVRSTSPLFVATWFNLMAYSAKKDVRYCWVSPWPVANTLFSWSLLPFAMSRPDSSGTRKAQVAGAAQHGFERPRG